jgi:hypothetical protein
MTIKRRQVWILGWRAIFGEFIVEQFIVKFWIWFRILRRRRIISIIEFWIQCRIPRRRIILTEIIIELGVIQRTRLGRRRRFQPLTHPVGLDTGSAAAAYLLAQRAISPINQPSPR